VNKRKWTPEEIKQWYRLSGAVAYCNKEDANVIVRKPNDMGWTVNWANPKAWLLQGGILTAVFTVLYLLKRF